MHPGRVFNSKAIAQAESAAQQGEITGNRVFTLKLPPGADPGRPLRFLAFGCQGSADSAQANVAALINDLSKNPLTRPDFILILGDNVYNWGADNAAYRQIYECFDDIYLKPALQELQHIPFFLLLGNHDENLQHAAIAAFKGESGIKRGLHEVAHNYLGDDQFSHEERVNLYAQSELPLAHLPSWNMPRRYYALIAGDTQIFCVDSSTYLKDYLELLAHPDTANPQNNQAAWLAEEVALARAAGRKIILAQHHPLYSQGRRAYHNDLKIYLPHRDIQKIPKYLGIAVDKHTTYNFCLKECLRRQHLEFDTILAAHDHNIYYYNNKHNPLENYKICQMTVGGGGGGLHDRAKFSGQQDMGCFAKKNAVVLVSHEQGAENFNLDIYSTQSKYNMKFNSSSQHPVIHLNKYDEDAPKIITFLGIVKTALDEYLSFLNGKQEYRAGYFFNSNISHGKKGVDRAHRVWAYINNPYPKSYAEIISDVYEKTKWDNPATNPAEHSLISILDKLMLTYYGVTMRDFANIYGCPRVEDDSSIEMTVMR